MGIRFFGWVYPSPPQKPTGENHMITYQVKVEEETEKTNASEEWFFNGNLHRENDLPAYTYNGDKYWYKHGERHRTNGPAVECDDGCLQWWLNGKRYLTQQDHELALNPHKELTIAEIEKKLGYKIKVVK